MLDKAGPPPRFWTAGLFIQLLWPPCSVTFRDTQPTQTTAGSSSGTVTQIEKCRPQWLFPSLLFPHPFPSFFRTHTTRQGLGELRVFTHTVQAFSIKVRRISAQAEALSIGKPSRRDVPPMPLPVAHPPTQDLASVCGCKDHAVPLFFLSVPFSVCPRVPS